MEPVIVLLSGCLLAALTLVGWLAWDISLIKAQRDEARIDALKMRDCYSLEANATVECVRRLDRIYAAMRDYVPQDFDPEDE